jgi:hypothetical protein
MGNLKRRNLRNYIFIKKIINGLIILGIITKINFIWIKHLD